MYRYVLPLMLSVMTARFVGNVFNEAIQDMQITVKKLPFLEVIGAALLIISIPRFLHNTHILLVRSLRTSALLFLLLLHSFISSHLVVFDHHSFPPPLLCRWN